MLKYLGNNFVLSGVIALILVIAVYIERRTSDKKNGHQSIKDFVFWGKLFGIGYILVLGVLLMKDKCPLSRGCSSESGSCGFSLSSLKNKLSKSSPAPWSSSGGGGSSNPSASVGQPQVSMSAPVQAPSVTRASDSGLKVIDLNNVNIGDPDF